MAQVKVQISAPGLRQRIGDTLEFKFFFAEVRVQKICMWTSVLQLIWGLWNGFLGFSIYYIFGGVQIYYHITKHHKYNIFLYEATDWLIQ